MVLAAPATLPAGRAGQYARPMEPAITIETGATVDAASAEAGELVEEELLVEEISIDGMCGVY